MSARFTYNSTTADFTIKFDSLDIRFVDEKSQNRSASGKIETINQHTIIEINFTGIMTAAQYRRMVSFYSWARQGNQFSFAAKSSQNVSATITDNCLGGGATATVPLGANSSKFSVGDVCLMRSTDHAQFELLSVTSVSDGTSLEVESQIYNYAQGAEFRHVGYFPNAVLINTNFNPMEMELSGYYKFDFQLVEAL